MTSSFAAKRFGQPGVPRHGKGSPPFLQLVAKSRHADRFLLRRCPIRLKQASLCDARDISCKASLIIGL
jgi:hypothetical protein